MRFNLTNFQRGAVNAALGAIGKKSSELVCLPTGSGKSVVIASLVERLHPSSARRILIVSHTREIVAQDYDAITRHAPSVKCGVWCSGLDRWDYSFPVIVASIHTIYDKTRSIGRGFDAVIVDEAHLIPSEATSMYRTLFANLRACRGKSNIPIIGFSATPYRCDTGYLHVGPDALFKRIAYDVPVSALVEDGTLSPLVTKTSKPVDFSKIRVRNGDFLVSDYTGNDSGEWRVDTAAALLAAAQAADERKRWLVFCCTVKHAEACSEILVKLGLRATCLHNGLSTKVRKERLAAFSRKDIDVLVNVNILTTGFNAPDVDCIVLLRPTMSAGLYVQMLGRGMRKSDGKRDCLVLDFSGNIERHGPLTDIVPTEIRKLHNDSGDRKTKVCLTCETELSAMAKQCFACGHLYSQIETHFSTHDPLPSPTQTRKARGKPTEYHIPSDAQWMSTEEVAGTLGTTPQYVKQMRHYKAGPKYSSEGGMTALGWKQVVYREIDVRRWMSQTQSKTSESGYKYRHHKDGSTPKWRKSGDRKAA